MIFPGKHVQMGRYKYLDLVIKSILKGKKIMIYGIRGVGKTTFLKIIKNHLGKLIDVVTIHVNLNPYKNLISIKKEILNTLYETTHLLGYKIENTLSYSLIKKCEKEKGFDCLANVKEQFLSDFNLRILIVLDDIHLLPTNQIDEVHSVIDISTSLKPIKIANYNIEEMVLKPLDAEELDAMFREMNVFLETHVILEILDKFTGIPAYLSLLIAPIKAVLRKGLPVDISLINFLQKDEKYNYLLFRIAESFYHSYKKFFGQDLIDLYYVIKTGNVSHSDSKITLFNKVGFLTRGKDGYTFTDKHLYNFLNSCFKFPRYP